MKTMIIQYERTAEERVRRKMFGDAGAGFKRGREPKFTPPLVCGTITTLASKDINFLEIYEGDDLPEQPR